VPWQNCQLQWVACCISISFGALGWRGSICWLYNCSAICLSNPHDYVYVRRLAVHHGSYAVVA
jgi:hypothetical protein